MSQIVLKTDHACKTYGKFAAVSDLDFQVKEGEIYALVGQNGAGKTTLLKMICGLAPLSSGTLELFGRGSERELEHARRKIGCMIETPGFFPYLSAEENLEYYRIQRGTKEKDCVKKALETAGIADIGRKKFRNFSLGMKQRLGLALAVMDEPAFLVLDEPINGLDPMGIRDFREIILRLNRESGTTVLISSHILGELSQIATTYGFIHQGRLIENVSAENLKEKCRSRLRLEVDDAQKAASVLAASTPCRDIERKDETTLSVGDGLDHPELLVKALVEHQVMVMQSYRCGISLEQYFLNLIGGEKSA